MLRSSAALLIVLLSIAAARAADADLGPVAPLVNDSTAAIVRADLSRIDLKDIDVPASPLDPLRQRLLDAGAKQIYIVAGPGAIEWPPGLLVVPLAQGADEPKITAALTERFASPPRPARDRRRGRREAYETTVQRVGDTVVVGRQDQVAALKNLVASPRPDLTSLLASAGDAPVAGAMALSPTASALLEQTLPKLPPQFGGHDTSALVRAFKSASYATDLKSPLTVKIQASDAKGAALLRPLAEMILKGMMKPIFADPKQPPAAPTIKAENDALLIEMTAQQVRDLYAARAAQTLWFETARNARDIGMALHTYYGAKKSWPADLNTLVKEGYIDASQIKSPRFPSKNPGFIYIKPQGKIQDIPGETITVYENVENDFSQGIVVGFQDGHAEILSSKEKPRFEQELKKTEAGNKSRQ